MSLTAPASARQIDAGLLILRLVVAAIFIAHGGQKIFSYGFTGVTAGFSQMGIPLPWLMGPFISILEFAGGIAIAAGLFTRLVGLGLAFNMLGAILFVHLKGGFFMPTGIEFALSLLGSSTLLALAGAGRFSLDAIVSRPKPRIAPAETLIRRAA